MGHERPVMNRRPGTMNTVAALLAALLLCFVSCQPEAEETDTVVPSISIPLNPAANTAGSQFISVTAGSAWTISSSASWASLSQTSGNGDTGGIVLSYSANDGEEAREVTFTVKSMGGSSSAVFRQMGEEPAPPEPQGPSGYGADVASPAWLELPATYAGDGREFFTHMMNDGRDRNYSFDYSYADFDAVWVAYPLNSGLIGSSIGGRTDAWGYDPLIPKQFQSYMIDEEGKAVSYGSGHTRGHQIPSADRYGTKANNAATFYATNMTPQDYNFNGGIWADLENNVRSLCRMADTLYVVTGSVLGNNSITDRGGHKVTVPDAYFKALLFYSTSSAAYTFTRWQGYSGIAVYMEHRSTLSGSSAKYALSIKELEEKTGLEFFVNLASKVGREDAEKIKAQGPENSATTVWPPKAWWN